MSVSSVRQGEGSSECPDGLRILLLSNMWPGIHDPVFGVFISRHVQALREAGASVRVVANRDARTGRLRTPLKYLSLLMRSLAAAMSGSYDVVVGHFLYPTAAIASAAARVARVPYAVVAHGTDVRSLERSSRIGRMCRTAVRRADARIAVSGVLADRLRVAAELPNSARVDVVHMGVDTAVFGPDDHARAGLGLSGEERVLLFAGKLVPVKGIDVGLRAFAQLRAAGHADALVIVGDGPLAGALREEARALGCNDSVRFVGQVTQPELAQWMAAADVFVLPSHDEGRGLVLLEAMACGTPCVASDVGGVPETLPAECGQLVPPGDPEALADAVRRVLESGASSYSQACIEHADMQNVDGQAERFISALEGMMRDDHHR